MGWLSLHKELAFLINAACGATFWTEQCCSGLHQKDFLQTRKALAQVVTRETSMTCRYRLWTVKIKGLSGWFQIHNWWEQDYEVQISAFHKEDESGSFTPGVCTLISGRGHVWGHFQLRFKKNGVTTQSRIFNTPLLLWLYLPLYCVSPCSLPPRPTLLHPYGGDSSLRWNCEHREAGKGVAYGDDSWQRSRHKWEVHGWWGYFFVLRFLSSWGSCRQL